MFTIPKSKKVMVVEMIAPTNNCPYSFRTSTVLVGSLFSFCDGMVVEKKETK